MQGAQTSSAILKIELLYADDLSRVPEQTRKRRRPHKILQVLEPADSFTVTGKASVRLRINDVSRNHRGRRFRLRLSAVHQGETIASIHTTPITVISKHPKSNPSRKRSRSRQNITCSSRKHISCSSRDTQSSENLRKKCCTGVNRAAVTSTCATDWGTRAFLMIKSLEKRCIGFGPCNTTITQCPSCLVVGNSESLQHGKNCLLAGLLADFVPPSTSSQQTQEEADAIIVTTPQEDVSSSNFDDASSQEDICKSNFDDACTYTSSSSSSSDEENEEVSWDVFQGFGGRTVAQDFEKEFSTSYFSSQHPDSDTDLSDSEVDKVLSDNDLLDALTTSISV